MMKSRNQLLLSVSALVLGMAMAAPETAHAVPSCDNTTIVGAMGSITWSSGNCSISSSGSAAIINASGSADGTLTNQGQISSAGSVLLNDGSIISINNAAGASIVSSASTGIVNNGSIGTVSNYGSISGAASGAMLSYGTIGSLYNSGTISGGFGIHNHGPIAILTNDTNGVISASVSAIRNDVGTIGTVVNNGLIIGKFAINNSVSITAINNAGTIISNINDAIINTGTIQQINNSGTISGAVNAINASTGSVGTITNSGLITGTTAVVNAASITAINNTGTIRSNTNDAIVNTGTLQQINNSGTISGAVNAINASAGAVGAITNSGVISGNISNSSSSALTINGGVSSYGTLTGSLPNSVGTISSTASNLVFGTGLLVLNDDINVASPHSVINTGATLQVTTARSITGNYSQSGGGLVFAVNGASTGVLSVSGNATINNTAVTISGTGLSTGNTFTIVRAGGTGTYLNDTGIVIGNNKLIADISTSGNDMVATLSRINGTYQVFGATQGAEGADMGRTLDRINRSTSPTAIAFQNQVLDAIDALPASARGSAIKQLAPTQVAPSTQMVLSNTGAVLGAVGQHQQTAMAYDSATGKAAGSESFNKTAWAQVLGGGAIRGSNSEGDGYRTTDFGLVGGADYHYDDNLMGGAALSWVRSWSNGADDSNGSATKMDSYQLTFYGTYRQGQAFFDGQLGAGYNSVNQSRAISVLGSTASSSYTGHQYLARGEIGWDQPFGDTTLTPIAGLRWLQSISDSYTETGAGVANLWVDQRTTNSVTQDLGVKASWNIDTSLGALKPEVHAAWLHDYTQSPIVTNGIMGGQAFASSTNRTVADGLQLGAVATLSSTDNLSLRAEYEGELRTKYQSHTGVLKAIVGF